MPLYSLTDAQVKNLHILINRSDIKGSDAVEVLKLKSALSNPINHDVHTGSKGPSGKPELPQEPVNTPDSTDTPKSSDSKVDKGE